LWYLAVELMQHMAENCIEMTNLPTNQQKARQKTAESPFPSVDAVLLTPQAQLAVARFGQVAAKQAVRTVLAALRTNRTTESCQHDGTAIADAALARLVQRDEPTLRPVFNLTGTVLHTNLGRAVLAEEAIVAVATTMREATNIEYDLASGKRGERDDHVRQLICELTGAEDCVVVNNAAAAVLLALSSLSAGKETIVSRGELIEIGGSFRIPDIMRRAGARLKEVGTTNRTHLADYRDAVSKRTAAIMKVHTSNYRIEGFTSEVGAQALAALAHDNGLPLIDDLGSGTFVDLERYGMARERTVQDALKTGADLVLFSGDKLLGGPQVGIIAGRHAYVQACARNHLKRALRVDKLRMAALAATLKLYRNPDTLPERLPTLKFFTRKRADLAALAETLQAPLQTALGDRWTVVVVDLMSQIGSGALPLETLESAGLAIAPVKGVARKALDLLSEQFRRLPTPVIGRIHDGCMLLDLRCLDDAPRFVNQLAVLRAAA
jgi:L-seryl-tRNA(Ser) seleniumtransferase